MTVFGWPILALGDRLRLTEYGAAQSGDPPGTVATVVRKRRDTLALGGLELRHETGRRFRLRYSEAIWRYVDAATL